MAADTPQIFVSIGRPQCEAQREFKIALMDVIRARGLEPRTVGREREDTDVSSKRPIEQIRQILTKCQGAVIVAYERHKAQNFLADSLADKPRQIADARLTTSWNQAETAMAYFSGLPILLLSEEGLWNECLLEDGVVGSVGQFRMGKEALVGHVFQRQMSSWIDDVREYANSRRVAETKPASQEALTLRDLVRLAGNMSWNASFIILGSVITLLGFVFSMGRWSTHFL